MIQFLHIAAVPVAFILMECVAWFSHKYIMHGPLWNLHHDHHYTDKSHVFEKNDLFFLFFAIPGILFLYFGLNDLDLRFWTGIGITLYGLAYFIVHDVFIHRRIKLFRNSNWIYFKALRRAHKMHHKHLGKNEGECFGMLFVPLKYFKDPAGKTPR